jgi:DNA-binding PadR family transcriptional regulator
VRDPRQVDMLLLAVLHGTPRTSGEAVEIIRERTGGRLVPSRGQVLSRFGYLERNRLVCRPGGGRRFRSTELGDRVLLSRLRELESLMRGVDALLGAEEIDSPRG